MKNTQNGMMVEDSDNTRNDMSLEMNHICDRNTKNDMNDYSNVFTRLNNYDIYNNHKTLAEVVVDHPSRDDDKREKMHRRVNSLPSKVSIAEALSNNNNDDKVSAPRSRTRSDSTTFHCNEQEDKKKKDKKGSSYKKRMKSVINQSSIKKISNKLKLNIPSHPLSKHENDDSSYSSQDNKKQSPTWNATHRKNNNVVTENDDIILRNIVWKRKNSSIGGLSDIYTHYYSTSHSVSPNNNISQDNNSTTQSYSNNLWEKRLLVLTKGGRLSYYHIPKDYDFKSMTIDSPILNRCVDSTNSSSCKTLHVVYDRAMVSARSASSNSVPTPFRIMVRTFKQMEFSTKTSMASLIHSSHDYKWQFCFENYSEQIQWLSTISHIIINNSVIHTKNKNIHNKSYLPSPIPFSQSINHDCFKEVDKNKNNYHNSCMETEIHQTNVNSSLKSSISPLNHQNSISLKQLPKPQNSSLFSYFAQQTSGIFFSCSLFLLWNMNFTGLYYRHTACSTATSSSSVWLIWIHFFLTYALFMMLYHNNSYSTRNVNDSDKGIQLSPSTHALSSSTSNQVSSSKSSSYTSNCNHDIPMGNVKATRYPTDHRNRNKENYRFNDIESIKENVPVPSSSTTKDFERNYKYKPKAGSTTIRLMDSKDAKLCNRKFIAWKPLVELKEINDIQLRGANYFETKKKEPCIGQIYSLQEVDSFESTGFIPNMSSRVELPPFEQHQCNKLYTAPDQLVISLSIPSKVPKFGISSSNEKEKGLTITMYFVLKEWARDVLNQHYTNKCMKSKNNDHIDSTRNFVDNNNDAPFNEQTGYTDDVNAERVNAVLLWERWCQKSSSDPKEQARFKVIVNSPNLRSLGVPNWICKYNGKPFLIKRPGVTGHLFKHSSGNIMEYDVTLLPFPYLFKQALSYLKDHYFKQLLINFAFVIEGRDVSELPECLIGDVLQLCYPDVDILTSENNFFSGNFTSAPRLKTDKDNVIIMNKATATATGGTSNGESRSHVSKKEEDTFVAPSTNSGDGCSKNNAYNRNFSINRRENQTNNIKNVGQCIMLNTKTIDEQTSLLRYQQSQN